MSKKSKWITGLAVAALSSSLAFAAVNDEHAGGKHFGRHDGKAGQEQMAAKLNLTAAQKQQWADAQKAFHEANKAFFDQSRQTMKDFRAAKEAGDTAKADALKPALESQRAQMKSLRDAQNQKLTSILDDQQKAQFQQMLAERGQHRHHHEQQQ